MAATGRRIWTPEAIKRLGMSTDVETAAEIIGIGRTLAYELVRRGEFPVRLIRLGRRVLVPTQDLLNLFGDQPQAS
jgi:excisionase family DNA binding protein